MRARGTGRSSYKEKADLIALLQKLKENPWERLDWF